MPAKAGDTEEAMHDCFGKPITPFCRVRAATVEELKAQGHPEASYPTTLSPAEQLALPAYEGTDTCNVTCVPNVLGKAEPTPVIDGQGFPAQLIALTTRGPATLHTARALVKLEG